MDPQTLRLGELQPRFEAAAEAWRAAGKGQRLWARDAALWTGGPEAQWLGWLDIASREAARIDELRRFAAEVAGAGFDHVLLIGMGGSSLGPEVIAGTFGPQPGHPALVVLDSTDPAQIASVERRLDVARTLVIVSSKSGTTVEPNILMDHVFARAEAALGRAKAGANFIAITDPGSALADAAKRRAFRRVFLGDPAIGGRYSVLSDFGLVPAAAMGLDVARLIAGAQAMMRACGGDVPPAGNPGIALGLALGVAAEAGRDKATILAARGLADFGAWLEQLLAESTGKHGKGIVPVDGERLGPPQAYGRDRVFIDLRLAGAAEPGHAERVDALAGAGHPVIAITLAEPYAIGGEFFRWEIATAVAGAVLGVDPFDQPDVEASKLKTRAVLAAVEKTGALPPSAPPLFEERGIALYADPRDAAALAAAKRENTLAGWLGAHFARLGAGDYCAFLAYLERGAPAIAALDEMRRVVRDRTRAATCVGFGPRFLHSTGQAHKGGPNSGVFLQITRDPAADLPVPGCGYGFGMVEAAQARGDFAVLAERGRRALRVHLARESGDGLARLVAAVRQAFVNQS